MIRSVLAGEIEFVVFGRYLDRALRKLRHFDVVTILDDLRDPSGKLDGLLPKYKLNRRAVSAVMRRLIIDDFSDAVR